jgi:hypothetical protein
VVVGGGEEGVEGGEDAFGGAGHLGDFERGFLGGGESCCLGVDAVAVDTIRHAGGDRVGNAICDAIG